MDTSTTSPMVGFDDNSVTVTWGREVYALDRDGQVSTQYQAPAHLVEIAELVDDKAREDAAIELVLEKLVAVQLSAKARRDIAEALGVSAEDVGQAPIRKASAA